MQAGQTGRRQQSGKTFLRLARFKRNAIEQQFVIRNAEQKASSRKRIRQFVQVVSNCDSVRLCW
jgi:hypothetical protein